MEDSLRALSADFLKILLVEHKVLSEKAILGGKMEDIALIDASGKFVYNPLYKQLDQLRNNISYIIVNSGVLRNESHSDD